MPKLVLSILHMFLCVKSAFCQHRIVNGEKSNEGQFPMVAFISTYCTGTLIHPSYILTAGHCFVKGILVEVFMGSVYGILSEGVKRGVVSYFRHPCYINADVVDANDIVILKLDRPYKLSPTIQLVEMAVGVSVDEEADKWDGKTVLTVGYGTTQPESIIYPKGDPYDITYVNSKETTYLRFATQRLMSTEQRGTVNVSKNLLVISSQDTLATICSGDSGGPVLYEMEKGRFVQIGFGHYGDDPPPRPYNSTHMTGTICLLYQMNQYFVRVDVHRDWIDTIIRTGEEDSKERECLETFPRLIGNGSTDVYYGATTNSVGGIMRQHGLICLNALLVTLYRFKVSLI